MTPPPDLTTLSSAEKDAFLLALLQQVEALTARVSCLVAENAALKTENAELKAESAALKAENAALREQLGKPPKTPRNSSLPPSRGQKPNAPTEDKAKPKKKARDGAHRPLHPKPDRCVDVHADQCPHCQAALERDEQAARHSYDRIEIPKITPDVTRVTLFGGTCPCCRKRFTADAPEGLEPGSPFGPHLRALVLYLHQVQAIPFERLRMVLFDLLGLDISEGAIANIFRASAPAFAKQASALRQKLLSGTILESDETSVRVGKRTWWTWVFHHGDTACFVIEPSRGKGVVESFLGDVRPAIWVSDRLGAQTGWATLEHQVCLSHLLRDIQYEIDAGGTDLATKLKALLKRAIRIGRYRPRLSDDVLIRLRQRYEERVDRILDETSSSDHAQKLLKTFRKIKKNLFVFMTNRDVPPTNNGSEQSLRPAVIFRKITNCFRSEWGAKLYADVRSVIETGRRRGIGPLKAITLALRGEPLPTAATATP